MDGIQAGHGIPAGELIYADYGESLKQLEEYGISSKMFSQFGGAELLAKKYKMTKEELDKFAALSQQRASDATKANRFTNEIIPLPVKKAKGDGPNEMHTQDEGIRQTNYDTIAKLKPMY